MKCPVCNCISSDKRDLCPKCGLDLRSHKTVLGLPVSHPKLSTGELKRLYSAPKVGTPPLPTPAATIKPEASQNELPVEKKSWIRSLFAEKLAPPKEAKSTAHSLECSAPQPHPAPSVIPPVPPELPLVNQSPTPNPATVTSLSERLNQIDYDALVPTELFEQLSETLVAAAEDSNSEQVIRQASSLLEELSEDDNTQVAHSSLAHYTSATSTVAPQVVEFHENDELFEQQLDAMLGDELIDITPVKNSTKTSKEHVPEQSEDDFEELDLDFEIELDGHDDDLAVEAIAPAIKEATQEEIEIKGTVDVTPQNPFPLSETETSSTTGQNDTIPEVSQVETANEVAPRYPTIADTLCNDNDIDGAIVTFDPASPADTIPEEPPTTKVQVEERPDLSTEPNTPSKEEFAKTQTTPQFDFSGTVFAGLEIGSTKVIEEIISLLSEAYGVDRPHLADTIAIVPPRIAPKNIVDQPTTRPIETPPTNNCPPRTVPPIAPRLWVNAALSLQELARRDSDEFDIAPHEVWTEAPNERFAVLFDLVDEELCDPTKAKHYVSALPSSEDRLIDNTELTREFSRLEKRALAEANLEDQIQAGKIKPETGRVIIDNEFAPIPTEPAKFHIRLAAKLIDISAVLIFSVILSVFTVIPAPTRSHIFSLGSLTLDDLLLVGFKFAAVFLVTWIVLSTALVAGWSRTFGKTLLKIEIVDDDGFPLSLQQSLLRVSSEIVTLLTFGIGTLSALGGKRKALHDHLAGSKVVKSF